VGHGDYSGSVTRQIAPKIEAFVGAILQHGPQFHDLVPKRYCDRPSLVEKVSTSRQTFVLQVNESRDIAQRRSSQLDEIMTGKPRPN
jgi:hypothetical protein